MKRTNFGIGLSFVFCVLVSLCELPAYAAVGRTVGLSAVSDSGEANYTIPIFVPPGINGLTPELALAYGHRQKESVAGVGWGITGLSEITRCAQTVAQNGAPGGVTLTLDDRFCLDGNQLMRYSGNYGSTGTTYRTEVDLMARITSTGTAGNGPQYFTVESKDGLIYEYGNSSDSRIESLALGFQTTARTWALSEIRDRSGNEIRFFYVEDGAPFGAHRIDKIEYRVNPTASLTQAGYRINFSYTTQPSTDVDTDYGAGGLIEDTKRLVGIHILRIDPSPDTFIRRYYLDYESSVSSTGRSRLESVEECISDTTECFSKTEFTYQDGTNGFDASVTYSSTIPSGVTPIVLDINGDGKSDVAWSSSATSGSGDWMYRLSTGTGFGGEVNSTHDNDGFSDAMVIDYNQDGMDDLLVPYSGGTWWVLKGSASSGFLAPYDTGAPLGAAEATAVIDINGDGRQDLVWGENFGAQSQSADPEVFVRYREETGEFSTTPVSVFNFTVASGWKILKMVTANHRYSRGVAHDVNGDGYEDIILKTKYKKPAPLKGWLQRAWIVMGSGAGNDYFDSNINNPDSIDLNGDGYTDIAYGISKYRISIGPEMATEQSAPAVSNLQMSNSIVIDWDSDGFQDRLAPNTSTNKLDYVRSNGAGFEAQADSGISVTGPRTLHPADVNGDGLTDVVYVKSDDTLAHALHDGDFPDLLTRATDGNGNYTDFDYASMSDSTIYQADTDAAFPEQDHTGTIQLVKTATHTDGVGGTYAVTYTYSGAQLNLQGRGLNGFKSKTSVDGRSNNKVVESFHRDFPYRGRPSQRLVTLSDTTPVQQIEYEWDKVTVAGAETSYFPYLKETIEENFEAEGTYNGDQINEITTTVVVDAYGTPTTITKVSVEDIAANGLQASAIYTEKTVLSGIVNSTSSWCLGKPATVKAENSHTQTFGTLITRTTNLSWDTTANCRLNSATVEPLDADYELVTSIDYDSFGNVDERTISGVGFSTRTTSTNWGTSGQFPTSQTNELSQVSNLAWDYELGVQTSATDPNGIVRSWQYDNFGRLDKETRPDSTYTSHALTACNAGNNNCSTSDGRVVTKLRSTSKKTDHAEIRYDDTFLDQLDRSVLESTQSMNASMSNVRSEYDEFGRMEKRSFPYFTGTPDYTTAYYDDLSRIEKVSRPISDTNSTLQNTLIYYEGLTRRVVDAESRESKTISDVLGRQIRVIDDAGFHQTFDLDAFGSVRKITNSDLDVLQTSTFEYGVAPFRVSSIDLDMEEWDYTYDALGELLSYDDDDVLPGQTVEYTYDKLSRPLTRVESEGTTTWTWGTSAANHNIGKLDTVSSPGVSESYVYDSAGRLSQNTNTLDSNPYQYDYAYNSTSGFLDTLTYPAINSQRSAVDYVRDYGWLTEVQNVSDGKTVWSALSRDARGNVTSRKASTSTDIWSQETSTFDQVTGSLKTRKLETNDVSPTNLVFDYRFEHNKAGNLTKRARHDSSGTKWLEELFYYDSVGRLDYGTYEVYSGGATTHLNFNYLDNGNVDSVQHLGDPQPTAYQYTSSKIHAATDFGADSFSYDDNGNMSSRAGKTVTWTSYNKPATINGTGGSYSTFSYGPDRARYKHIRKFGTNGVETIYYAGLTEDDGDLQHNVIADGEVVGQISHDGTTESWVTYHKDHLGSIVAKTDPGTSLDQAFFGAMGQRKIDSDWTTDWTPPSGGWDYSRGFTGHEQLYHLGLIHMNGRVYDSGTGRFLSADPFIPNAGLTQAFNRFSYVNNDPLSFTDPTGYTPCLDPGSFNICINVLASFFSFFGFGGSGGPVPPPPNHCYLAGPTGCYGSAPSKFEKIFNDIFGLPGDDTNAAVWGPCVYCLYSNDEANNDGSDDDYNDGGWSGFGRGVLEGLVSIAAEMGRGISGRRGYPIFVRMDVSADGIFGRAVTNQQQLGRDVSPVVPIGGVTTARRIATSAISRVHRSVGSNATRQVRRPGMSGHDAATDIPSWARGEAPLLNENGRGFAKRLLGEKYGAGKFPTGPGSEFSKLKKFADRAFENPPGT